MDIHMYMYQTKGIVVYAVHTFRSIVWRNSLMQLLDLWAKKPKKHIDRWCWTQSVCDRCTRSITDTAHFIFSPKECVPRCVWIKCTKTRVNRNKNRYVDMSSDNDYFAPKYPKISPNEQKKNKNCQISQISKTHANLSLRITISNSKPVCCRIFNLKRNFKMIYRNTNII